MSSGHLHPQYNLRWPEELRDKIAASAKAHNRSMNADIVARLEQSFTETHSPNQQQIAELNQRLADMEVAYRQSIAHYDRILKMFEQKIDLKDFLTSAERKEAP